MSTLEEAERAARECDEAGVPLTWRSLNVLLAEYDRRGTELTARKRATQYRAMHVDHGDDVIDYLQARNAALSSLLRGMARRATSLRSTGEAEIERLRARTHEIQAQEMTKRAALDSEVALWRQRYEKAKRWTEDNGLLAEWALGECAAHPFWSMTSYNARSALLRLVTERDESVRQVAAVEALADEWDAANEPAGETLRAVLDGQESRHA